MQEPNYNHFQSKSISGQPGPKEQFSKKDMFGNNLTVNSKALSNNRQSRKTTRVQSNGQIIVKNSRNMSTQAHTN